MAELSSRGIFLQNIEFSDGTIVDLHRNSIVLLTGPNNCGKSKTLKEILYHPVSGRQSIVTRKITSAFVGNMAELVDELRGHPALKINNIIIDQAFFQSAGNPYRFLTLIAQQNHMYRAVASSFMPYLSTLTRLMSFGVARENTILVNVQQFAMSSLSRLYEDKKTALKVYSHTKSAFGKGVAMNHASLQDSDLYFYDKDTSIAASEEGTSEYARWFEKLERLNEQGDGVQSFSAILIALFQQLNILILLDEPEAFLHPPQIRELARIIALETPPDTQLIVATHSDDFVRGMMDFASSRTSVIRMTRHRQDNRLEINRLRKLDVAQISAFWDDPLLRTSDVLTSLFHQVAVIVEGDSDARFFRSLIDVISAGRQRSLDLKFIQCGGKGKISKIAAALRAIGVGVVCIVDIDILDNKTEFLALVAAFGGDQTPFLAPFEEISSFVNQKQTRANCLVVKQEVLKILESADVSKPLSDEASRKLIEIVKPHSAWTLAKQYGDAFFASGSTFNAFQKIRDESLKNCIFINKVGELENYCRRFSSKRKNEWLAEVMSLDLTQDIELKDARDFAQELLRKCEEIIS